MELDAEIKAQIQAALDAGDLGLIRDMLDTLDSLENPNIVKVELTISQMRDMKAIQAQLNHPSLSATFGLMAESFVVGFKKGKQDARAGRARAPG
jgi:RNA-binding protein YhbY